MKIAVLGADGQLGRALVQKESGHELILLRSSDCNILEPENVSRALWDIRPDVVLHCAAYTAVDKAETERDLCYQTNVEGTKNVMKACQAVQATLAFISTDYVFDGTLSRPYETTDETNPLNFYGYSKNEAEKLLQKEMEKLFILRTSWLFGDGKNFIKTMLRLAAERPEVSVVADQVGSPTYAADLANLIYKIVETDCYGMYHTTNSGFCSWADLAEAVFKHSGLDTAVKRVTSKEYITPAKRPTNSRLSKQKLLDNGFPELPDWEDALCRYLKTL